MYTAMCDPRNKADYERLVKKYGKEGWQQVWDRFVRVHADGDILQSLISGAVRPALQEQHRQCVQPGACPGFTP
jgi:hypothetical protein